jgi:hypothetical protein
MGWFQAARGRQSVAKLDNVVKRYETAIDADQDSR